MNELQYLAIQEDRVRKKSNGQAPIKKGNRKKYAWRIAAGVVCAGLAANIYKLVAVISNRNEYRERIPYNNTIPILLQDEID